MIVTTAPALYQLPLDGLIVPAQALGLGVVVSWYCVVKFAVYVVAVDGAVMLCVAVPLSDHEANTYWMPVPPDCGPAATTVCDVPVVHVYEQGVVQVTESTVMTRPDGTLAIVCVACACKLQGNRAQTETNRQTETGLARNMDFQRSGSALAGYCDAHVRHAAGD